MNSKEPCVVVCLDLALANTGIAVLRLFPQGEDELVWVNTVHTEKSSKSVMRKANMRSSEDEWRRVKELCIALGIVLLEYKPAHVFIEVSTGGSKSAQAAKSMAVSRGAACAVITQSNLPCTLVTPFEAKRAATGNMVASKDEVKQAMLAKFPAFQGWVKGKSGKIVQGLNEHVYDALSVYMAAKDSKFYKELKGYDTTTTTAKSITSKSKSRFNRRKHNIYPTPEP